MCRKMARTLIIAHGFIFCTHSAHFSALHYCFESLGFQPRNIYDVLNSCAHDKNGVTPIPPAIQMDGCLPGRNAKRPKGPSTTT